MQNNKPPFDWAGFGMFVFAALLFIDMILIILAEANLVR